MSHRSNSQLDEGERFTLERLCQEASVTIRTVRYYIAEGLLPPPHGQGPGARYGAEHLQRLQIIAGLKARFLPLREIRRVLDSLDSEGIAELASEFTGTTGDRPVHVERSRRMGIAEERPAFSEIQQSQAFAAPNPAASYIEDLLGSNRTPAHRPLPPPASQPAPEKSWRRVPITDDAELLIEADTLERRREQIESLVAWAQKLLRSS